MGELLTGAVLVLVLVWLIYITLRAVLHVF